MPRPLRRPEHLGLRALLPRSRRRPEDRTEGAPLVTRSRPHSPQTDSRPTFTSARSHTTSHSHPAQASPTRASRAPRLPRANPAPLRIGATRRPSRTRPLASAWASSRSCPAPSSRGSSRRASTTPQRSAAASACWAASPTQVQAAESWLQSHGCTRRNAHGVTTHGGWGGLGSRRRAPAALSSPHTHTSPPPPSLPARNAHVMPHAKPTSLRPPAPTPTLGQVGTCPSSPPPS